MYVYVAYSWQSFSLYTASEVYNLSIYFGTAKVDLCHTLQYFVYNKQNHDFVVMFHKKKKKFLLLHFKSLCMTSTLTWQGRRGVVACWADSTKHFSSGPLFLIEIFLVYYFSIYFAIDWSIFPFIFFMKPGFKPTS